MKIRTVIPILNNQWLTTGALLSLRSEMDDGLDVVLVDNGSDDESLACLRADIDQPGSGIRLIKNERPRAYARSVNMGAALAGDWDALLVTNNDVIFAPGSIQEMVDGLGGLHELVLPLSPRDVAAAGVSPPRLSRPGTYPHVMANHEAVAAWWERSRASFSGYRTITHPYVPQGGYAFLISRPLWERLGGMDESYELFGEDYDLFDRATRWTKMVQARGAYVEHLEHQTVAWLGDERDIRMCKARFKLAEEREGLRELFSVVIPTYNRTDALFEAMDSVLRQTVPHWKLYVVDDGSKDWDRIQKAALERYRGQESRIWFFRLPENQGPGAARNFGLDLAQGKYVAFLDSDDIWKPDHLEKHLAIHETSPSLLMSYSRTTFAWRWWDEATHRYRYRMDDHPEKQLQDPTFSKERLERENFIKTSAVVVNGAVLRREGTFSDPIRFPVEDEHRMAAEDWTFFRRVAERGMVALVDRFTARTHWSKLADGEAHHSSRIVPWADFGEVSKDWAAREIALPEIAGEVTVVVPSRERTEECVNLLNSLPDVPVIIAADGLKTGRPLIPLTQERPNMGLVIVDEPKGPSFARNRGVEAARSPWVWLLDDDDLPVPGALDAILEHLDGADVVIGDLIVSAEGGLKLAKGLYTSAMFVRVETYQRAGGFDEGLRWAEERELLPRLEALGAVVKKLAMPVAIKTVGSFKALSLSQAPKISEKLRSSY